MNKVMKGLATLLAAVLLSVTLLGCARDAEPRPDGGAGLQGAITASGSTALLPLVTAAKELFEESHDQVTVNVSGGGSFNGLSQVNTGAVQIGNSDVEATGEQSEGLVDHKVSVSPFVIIVHKDVTAGGVTLEQLARILRGEITNWQEVGGSDAQITVISRPQSSGSRATIVDKVLKGQGDFTKDAVVQDSNGKVFDGVITTPGAIGYVDAPYFNPEKASSLKIDGVAYSPEAVISGNYPIWAYGHMYTKGEPQGLTRAFLDFIVSPEFQEGTAEQLGFIPVTKMP